MSARSMANANDGAKLPEGSGADVPEGAAVVGAGVGVGVGASVGAGVGVGVGEVVVFVPISLCGTCFA